MVGVVRTSFRVAAMTSGGHRGAKTATAYPVQDTHRKGGDGA